MKSNSLDGYHIGEKVSYMQCPHCDGHGFRLKKEGYLFIFTRYYVSNEVCGICRGNKRVPDDLYHQYMDVAYRASDLGVYDYKYRYN